MSSYDRYMFEYTLHWTRDSEGNVWITEPIYAQDYSNVLYNAQYAYACGYYD